MHENRLRDVRQFYVLLGRLEQKLQGARRLADCSGRLAWPQRGVYFFQEDGEQRSDSGEGRRVVRVGTHALKDNSGTRLWGRLSQHKGNTKSGGGNHRGSIFRLIVGTALIAKDDHCFPTWGQGNAAEKSIRENEILMERLVSEKIGAMPILWLDIGDDPGAESLRGYIERNAIALLSNYGKSALDPPSHNWLGHLCNRPRVQQSGLWNHNHVNEEYEPAFLNTLSLLIDETAHRQ